jgi:Domain of unknown function (DUF222)
VILSSFTLLPALTVWRRPRRRQGQALRVALRRLRASLDPSSGRRGLTSTGAGPGNGCQEVWQWVGLGGRVRVLISVFVILLGKQLVIERIFEYNGGMELGDPTATTREPRSRLDAALDHVESAVTELIGAVEDGQLEQLSAEDKVAVWQRFERLRNRLPLIDHQLIANAEAHHLSEEYCSSTITQFLIRVLQLSPGDAATRIRAAAAVGPRTTMLGEKLEPRLPQLAALQHQGVVSTEKVAIVERAMHKLTRHDLDPQAVETAEQLLTEHAAILAPAELKRFAHAVINAADPDGPEPVDDQRQQDRRYLELKQRRDGMWDLAGRLTNTVGAQLNAILDPLTKPRSTAIEDEDGTIIDIPDQRPQVHRLHDALEEACARLLKAADQPSVGGIPAAVIVTISLEDLLAKAGLAETAAGTQLTSDQLLRITDEAEIWPTIIDQNGVPLALGRSRRLASAGQTMALIARDAGCSFPGCTHPPQWCDRHHILDWILGGPTDLDNMTLLCRYHHTHFLQKGWSCRINTDGLPEWIPPRWIDQDQRPQVNARIRRLNTQRQFDHHNQRRRTPTAA